MALYRRSRANARRAARGVARRTGNLDRLEMLEAAFNPVVRRGMLDSIAMKAVIAAVLRPDSHTVDVGASTGEVLSHLIRVAPRGRHVAYEPIPHHARFLTSAFPQVDVREAALSDSEGTSTFQHVVRDSAYSGLLLRPDISAGRNRSRP